MTVNRLRLEAVWVRYPSLRPYDGDFSPNGWALLIADAVESIAAIEHASGFRARVAQVKEKFGGLGLYASGGDESLEGQRFAKQLNEIVRAAEQRAARTCQVCGQPGRLHRGACWYVTACAQHARGAEVVPET